MRNAWNREKRANASSVPFLVICLDPWNFPVVIAYLTEHAQYSICAACIENLVKIMCRLPFDINNPDEKGREVISQS